MWHSLLPHFFFLCLTRSVLYRMCVYKHISDCIEILYKLPLVLYNMTSETFLHRSGVMWGVYQIIVIGVPAWLWLGKYMTLDKTFYSLCKAGISSSFSHFKIFFLITFLKEAFIRSWVIINAVVNNNYGRLQDIILLFRILMGTWKNLFKIYRHCWHAPSKKFVRLALHSMYTQRLILALNSCHMCVIWYFLFYFLETTWNSFESYSCLSAIPCYLCLQMFAPQTLYFTAVLLWLIIISLKLAS